MAQITGSSSIDDLLAARFQSVADFDEDNIREVLDRDLAAHNAIMMDLVGGLCEITVDRQRIYGSSVDGDMQEVDEFGNAPTQRSRQGSTVAFPLRLYQFPLGWTKRHLAKATPADLAESTLAAEKAHRRVVEREIRKAIFLSSNSTFRDHLVDDVDLAVRAFVNADGNPIPNSPIDGTPFVAGSHTHYDANATLTTAVVDALIEDVMEHSLSADIKIAIHRTNEAAWRALTGFIPYADQRIEVFRVTGTGNDVPFDRLDQTRFVNRAIGIYGAAEVWVKSWSVANYAFCWDDAGPRPLAFRQDTAETLQGLQLSDEAMVHPLQINTMEAMLGVGVWERTNGAVLQFNNATYQNPTIT